MPIVGIYDIVPAPSGSSGANTTYPISDSLLNTLSDSGKSSLLSVANIGASTLSKITTALETIGTLTDLETYLLDGTQLDSLANGALSSSFAFANVGTSRFVRVVLILGEITPTGTPSVELISGTEGFTVSVPSGAGEKRVEFNDIPEAFVNNFQIQNSTGVSFASSGNSVVVVAL